MDRLVNALVQKDPNYRKFMGKLKEAMNRKNRILTDVNSTDKVNSITWNAKMHRNRVEEDLYYILVEKTK